MPSEFARHWNLDPQSVFLNHGSFGAVPKAVGEFKAELERKFESQPVRFLDQILPEELAKSRTALARFLDCPSEELVFVPNATFGVNAVMQSFPLEVGDHVLVTNHEYNACRNALDAAASKAGATVDVVEIPFPFSSGKDLMDPILAGVHRKTRLALLDHITSPTGVLMPMAAMVSALQEQGVQVLVDGAHVPGQVQVSLSELGADFFTGNCHKWLCTPIGSALLHVPMRNQDFVRPPVVSHGRNTTLAEGRSRFTEEFDWTGTFNPTPWLSIPTAIESIESMMEGGWPAIQERNHELALAARDLLCSALGIEHPVPDDYLASLVSIPLPPGSPKDLYADLSALGFEVPVMAWPPTPPDGHLGRCIRLSCQLYNSIDDYERLAEVLPCLLARA